MDNRTIRRAMTRRVPEVYFIDRPVHIAGKVVWALIAKINGRPYKLLADMPDTALVSHTELLNTMVSEVYDEVAKIKRGAYTPPLVPGEESLDTLDDEALRLMSFERAGEMAEDLVGNKMAKLM